MTIRVWARNKGGGMLLQELNEEGDTFFLVPSLFGKGTEIEIEVVPERADVKNDEGEPPRGETTAFRGQGGVDW